VPASRQRRYRILIGVDTGGTFTDFVAFVGKDMFVHKRPSTPDNPARAVLGGLAELMRLADAKTSNACITYGSTVATNAMLEGKGARVVLLTTRGFEDVIEIGRQTRPDLYALEPRLRAPLVGRSARVGVEERTTYDGRVERGLSRAALAAALAAVERLRGESVAVCLLHSYANPEHERLIGEALRERGIECTLSHQLIAEYREYERTSTTVMNAYVAPVMRRHLAEIAAGVGAASLRVMQSNGGAVSVGAASREAVRTLLSGPAGGVVGAMAAGRRVGSERLITFDMGGTSTDVSLVDAAARRHTEWTIGDLPVKVPAIDIHTVGAGGGSIAYRDPGGALKVGPQSAGADPGPACYGRGERATVTDADLLLGRLVPDAFLAGEMSLDVARAERAVGGLARKLGLGRDETAEGVVRVVEAGMERAIRRISVERGHDPREYLLVAFGGAAGMHACALAAGLGMRRVLLPIHPGLLSAWGAVSADVERDYVQTVRLVEPAVARLKRAFAPLRAHAMRDLRAESAAGKILIESHLDLRYQGQSYEIQLPMRSRFRQHFHDAHRRLYGYADPERPVEVVNLRVLARIRGPALPRARPSHVAGAASSHRLRQGGRWTRARRIERAALPANRALRGPLVITELSATTVVPTGWTARQTVDGDLLLTRPR
jgi:N-methylhydantoinase A